MPTRRVAILVETSGNYGRDVMRGVVDWARAHADWQFSIECGDASRTGLLPGWSGDGVICRPQGPQMAAAVAACDLPLVALGHAVDGRGAGTRQVALQPWHTPELAAQAVAHLTARGHRHLAFCSHPEKGDYGRLAAFTAAVGHPVPVWRAPERGDRRSHLGRWLLGLPRPCGIWAANDSTGFLLLELCHSLGIAVPRELAVLGCDNDSFLCELAHPALSSVAQPTYALGRLAAGTLDALIERRPLPPALVPPIRLVARASTDWSASADPLAAAAAARIATAPPGTTMASIARGLGVSARSLERHLRGATGTTPGRLARDRRLAEAQRLLAGSDLGVAAIAERVGYSAPARMTEAFRRITGLSPGAWRRQHAGG